MEGVHSNFKTTTQHVNFVRILQVHTGTALYFVESTRGYKLQK